MCAFTYIHEKAHLRNLHLKQLYFGTPLLTPPVPALKFIQYCCRDHHLLLHLKRWQLTRSEEVLQGNKNPRQIEAGMS